MQGIVRRGFLSLLAAAALICEHPSLKAQTPPSSAELEAYSGLHAAVVSGGTAGIERLVRDGADINARDAFGRTPLMVAVYRRDDVTARVLIDLGANVNALEYQSYDAITIAAVQNDAEMLDLLIKAVMPSRLT